MTETILLTGISGFIAKHIAVKLLNAGYNVRGSLRNMSRADEVSAAVAPFADVTKLTFVALDLNSDDHWAEAMNGVSALIHTASPFPIEQPTNEDDLIRPAVDGTLRAMASARAAGVMRVVLTSSTVALTDPMHRGMMDETTWCDPDAPETSAYAKSKTLAESAAWEFAGREGMSLTTINPGFVMGPPLDNHYGSSISVVARLLRGKDPMLPNIGFAVVDVRDVAEAHVRALQTPSSAGKRFPCVTGTMTMPEMGKVLKRAYPNRRIATRTAPKYILRFLSKFDPQIRAILPELGKIHVVSNRRARTDLEMRFISSEGALRACADWLLNHGAL